MIPILLLVSGAGSTAADMPTLVGPICRDQAIHPIYPGNRYIPVLRCNPLNRQVPTHPNSIMKLLRGLATNFHPPAPRPAPG